MNRINIHAAKTNLSRLIAGVEDGGADVLLCRAGRPVAKISKASQPLRRIPGLLAGQIWMADDFDTPDGALFGIKS